MKKLGVTRKIDELGRIVVPKEIRNNLNIKNGDYVEIYVDEDMIILKKYEKLESILNIGNKLCEMINNIFNVQVFITNKDKVISSSNNNYLNKNINEELMYLIDNREILNNKQLDILGIGYYTCIPIIHDSDSLGLVIIVSEDSNNYLNLGKLITCMLLNK